jgi:hypothetical protein
LRLVALINVDAVPRLVDAPCFEFDVAGPRHDKIDSANAKRALRSDRCLAERRGFEGRRVAALRTASPPGPLEGGTERQPSSPRTAAALRRVQLPIKAGSLTTIIDQVFIQPCCIVIGGLIVLTNISQVSDGRDTHTLAASSQRVRLSTSRTRPL